MEVDRSIKADKLIDVIKRLVVTHGAPEHLHMDNGPEAAVMGTSGLVPIHRHPDQLHRAGQPLGEPFRRVVQRPSSG